MCATNGAGTAYPSGSHEFNSVRVARSLVFCVVLCRSLFALSLFFLLAIVLSALPRFTDSDYPFGTYKFFSQHVRSWSREQGKANDLK